jgi:hypothetical protein
MSKGEKDYMKIMVVLMILGLIGLMCAVIVGYHYSKARVGRD